MKENTHIIAVWLEWLHYLVALVHLANKTLKPKNHRLTPCPHRKDVIIGWLVFWVKGDRDDTGTKISPFSSMISVICDKPCEVLRMLTDIVTKRDRAWVQGCLNLWPVFMAS